MATKVILVFSQSTLAGIYLSLVLLSLERISLLVMGGEVSIIMVRCLYQIPPFRTISPLAMAGEVSITTMVVLSPYQIPLSQKIPLKAPAVVGAPSSASER
jgi:hypothetical protein